MADVKWIKVATDIFEDEKVINLESHNEGYAMICLWLNLLCRAKLKNRQGLKEFKIANVDLTDEALNAVFHYKGESIGKAIAILEGIGMVKRNKKSIVVIPFWQERHDRCSTRYRYWRQSVFERDEYTCQGCGTKKNLQAHHIIHWNDCTGDKTELRYSAENGVTLCRACHLEAHGGCWRG
jgi:predicted phage replisome organizer